MHQIIYINAQPCIELSNTEDILRCVNNRTLETRLKIVDGKIDGICRSVKFTVVKHMIPDIIDGIELQKQFGIKLQ